MKKKLMGLELVLSLGIVVATIGTVFLSSKPAMVAAEDAKSTGVYLKGNFNSWGTTDLMYFKTGSSYDYYITKALASGDTFKIYDNEHDGGIWVNNLDASISSALFSLSSDLDPNVVCNKTGLYKLTYTYSNSTTRWISSIASIYAISEYAVVDGTIEATAFATENAESTSPFTPTAANRSGYLFDDWYTDAACTNKYSARAWEEAGTLYAKYTHCTTEKYVYFSAPGWSDCYAYTFGGKSGLGDFPGTKITQVTNGVNYQGSGVYKATFYGDSDDTKIVFDNGSGGTIGTNQTADLVLSENTFYKLSDTSTGDSDRGLAAAVVYEINAARKAVTASESILAESICGIGKATATALLTKYDALNDIAKGYVNSATDYVYNSENTSGAGIDVAFDQIIAELRLIANKTGSSPAAITGSGDSAWAPAWIALISLSIAAVASAGLLIGRHKHE